MADSNMCSFCWFFQSAFCIFLPHVFRHHLRHYKQRVVKCESNRLMSQSPLKHPVYFSLIEVLKKLFGATAHRKEPAKMLLRSVRPQTQDARLKREVKSFNKSDRLCAFQLSLSWMFIKLEYDFARLAVKREFTSIYVKHRSIFRRNIKKQRQRVKQMKTQVIMIK